MKPKKSRDNQQRDKILNQIPIFLAKTYRIVDNPQYADTVQWIPEENGFVVKNITDLTQKIFPKHFKHTNYASFVRQLNLYGFHKVRSNDQGHIFTHNYFQKNNPQLLTLIKRKNAGNNDYEKSEKQQKESQNYKSTQYRQLQKSSQLAIRNPPSNMMLMQTNPQQLSNENMQLQRQLGSLAQKHESLQNLVSVLVQQNKQIIMQNKSFINKINNMDDNYRKKLQTLIFLMVFGLKNGDNNIIVPQQLNHMIKAFTSNNKKEKKSRNNTNGNNGNNNQNNAVQLFKKPMDQGRFYNKKIEQILQMLKMQSQGQGSGAQDGDLPQIKDKSYNQSVSGNQDSRNNKNGNNLSIFGNSSEQKKSSSIDLNNNNEVAPPSPMPSMRSLSSRYFGQNKVLDDWNDLFEKLDHSDLDIEHHKQ